ncbi:MAG TPA: hypothetical protein VGL59_15125 [Polyangia bacterium]|jgi:hypothetical protein
MGKGEDKRAAIIAQQAAREQATPTTGKSSARKRRTGWSSTAFNRPSQPRPPSSGPTTTSDKTSQ